MGFINPLTDVREVCPACKGRGTQPAPKGVGKPQGTYGIDRPIQTFPSGPGEIIYCPACIDPSAFCFSSGHCRRCGDSGLTLDFTPIDRQPVVGELNDPKAPIICIRCAASAIQRIPTWESQTPPHVIVVLSALHKPGGLWKMAVCTACLQRAIDEAKEIIKSHAE